MYVYQHLFGTSVLCSCRQESEKHVYLVLFLLQSVLKTEVSLG